MLGFTKKSVFKFLIELYSFVKVFNLIDRQPFVFSVTYLLKTRQYKDVPLYSRHSLFTIIVFCVP
jgi:hypothetical protein